MGQLISFPRSGYPETKTIMVGLDNAGKTTILYKLKLGQEIETIPTIGFNVESVRINNVTLTIWDLCGQEKIRPIWRHFFEGSVAVVFVIDSVDTARFDEAKNELHKLFIEEFLKDSSFLILANKQDMENAIPVTELQKLLELDKVKQSWFIQGCSATKGNGLDLQEGFEWLADISNKKLKRTKIVKDYSRMHYAGNTATVRICSII